MSRIYQPTLEECLRYGLRHGDRMPDGRKIVPPIAGAGDFRLQDGMIAEGLARLYTSPSSGATVSAGSTASTKGAWVQLSASTARDATSMYVSMVHGSIINFMLDIGIGASGAEVVIVPNIFSGATTTALSNPQMIIPIAIPGGSRVAARCQSASSSSTLRVGVSMLSEGFASPSGFSRVTDYGAVTASTTGTAITAGVANTKGSYSQLVASMTNPCSALMFNFWPLGGSGLVDLAIGAAGSEQIILPDVLAQSANSQSIVVPMSLAAGTRIACRWQSSASSAQLQATAYGID